MSAISAGDDASNKPRDARTIEAILAAMGVEEYDERVTHQLLELLYKHVWQVLEDARALSEHADKREVDAEDVRLAIRACIDTSFTRPPSRDVTLRVARECNTVALPPVDSRAGVALPRPEFQLTAQNFTVVLPPPKSARAPPKANGSTNGSAKPN